MDDASPPASATPEACNPEPGLIAPTPPRRISRAMRNPFVRVASAVVGLAVGWGAFQGVHDLWATRNDNTPISATSHAPSGALLVSGHGLTLVLPHRWVNVPTTPNKLTQFMRASAAKFPHLRAAIKSELESIQNLRCSPTRLPAWQEG